MTGSSLSETRFGTLVAHLVETKEQQFSQGNLRTILEIVIDPGGHRRIIATGHKQPNPLRATAAINMRSVKLKTQWQLWLLCFPTLMVSRKIRDAVRVPVFLAGGLKSANLHEAIAAVQPFGVDVCTGVRTDDNLDPGKLRAFFDAM